MPTVKGKGGSISQRYRPASKYDDATLAQKREYWRTKKREQRARLSERTGKAQVGGRLPNLQNSSSSGPLAAPSFQSIDELHKTVSPAPQTGSTAEDRLLEVSESQKEKWLQTMKLNKVLPHLGATCAITARAASSAAAMTCLKARAPVNRAVTSSTSSGAQLDTSSSVPPVRASRYTNGSSVKAAIPPCVSMQGPSIPKMQHKSQVAHVALGIQPKLLPTNVTRDMIFVSSSCGPVSVQTESKTPNTTPQSRTKSALQRAKGNAQSTPESEEERAAKRREHWRIKKREQRAKLAARIAKARERMQCTETTVPRQTVKNAALVDDRGLQHSSPQVFLRGAGRRQCASRVKTLFAAAKREHNKLKSRKAGFAAGNAQDNPIKAHSLYGNRTAQTASTPDVIPVRKTGETQRKCPNYFHLFNVARGISHCKTPRQRLIESQNLMNQRNLRCKFPLDASVFESRNIPRIDPGDTPEQVVAKRREYWRIKKREQRAKLSMDVKARLKEKDSLMRRAKRYQKILEEMRKARALTTGSTLAHASETIGGFIKEDGTLTINIPQGLTHRNTAAQKRKGENLIGSKNAAIAQPQHQSNMEPLCSAPVKVAFSLAEQSENKPARLRAQHESVTVSNSHPLTTQTVGQLTLTHPKTSLPGGCATELNAGGCVMKMAISSTAPPLSALPLDSTLSEEERMANKREYWRIKKREQRAACAARLKQGVLNARANAALQRRKVQKQLALINVQLSRSLNSNTGGSRPPSNAEPLMPLKNDIKQESESMPAVDSQPEQAIRPDIKPPTSPPPPPVPELDMTLSADSQATTLLAVASMKKLLEESLSTVTEDKGERTDIKTETTEDALKARQNLPQQFFQNNGVAPVADPMSQVQNWQPDTDALVHTSSPSPQLRDSSHLGETFPPRNTSSEVVPHPASEHSSQAPSDFMVKPSSEATGGPSSPRRTHRLQAKKASHQNCCSPEPPKLHHLPLDQLHPLQQHCEQQREAQGQYRNSSPPAPVHSRVTTDQSGLTSLQRKREYWKLMKRQQRAKLKARQKETQGECSSHLSSRNAQAPGLTITNPPAKLAPQPWQLIASVPAVPGIPAAQVTSPVTCNDEQPPGTLQVVNSVSCSLRSEQSHVNIGPSQIMPSCLGARGQQQAVPSQKWVCKSTDIDSGPLLPTLKPPDNPLSSINLQPIELPDQTTNSTLSPVKSPLAQFQSLTPMIEPAAKLAPICTMVPPKPVPGEPEEDFLKRKREYWRIKKKEQRARKAIQDKGSTPRRSSENWRPILPTQDLETQDLRKWGNSTEESDHLLSTSLNINPGSFPCSNYTAPIEDESEVLFVDYENNDCEEGPVADAVWRNCYLMDYDPLNQLLVCMVCGDLQYSHSLEGVRAHIDETHPETLKLDNRERQQILEAWDEQVSQRERFFISQLQQHSGSLAGTTEAQRK